MAETVSDILGKGFKFENRVIVELLPPEKITGTIPAFIGGGHWGPVGEPTFVQKSFSNYFGSPVVAEDENDNRALDFSGLGAEFHLRYSQYCYYTRISDGTDKAASRLLKREAKIAKFLGSGASQNGTATISNEDTTSISRNNIFVVKKDDVVREIEVTPSSSVSTGVDISSVVVASLIGQNILFSIDGTLFTYKITGSETDLIADLQAVVVAKLLISSTDAQKYVYALTINDIDVVDEDFETDDIIKIGSNFYEFDGTDWSEITVSTVTTIPTANPEDDAWFYDTVLDTAHQFDETGGTFDVNPDQFSAPVATVPVGYGNAGEVVRLTADDGGLVAGLIQTNGTDTWSQLEIEANITEVTALPVIKTEDANYFNSVTDLFYTYTFTSNTITPITTTFSILDYVVFASQNFGKTSTITIHTFAGTSVDENNSVTVTGQDTSVNAIVAEIASEISEDVTAIDSVGLYKKVGGTWTLETETTIYGTVPEDPSDNDYYKADGSGTMAYGWYQYDLAETEWVSIGAVSMITETDDSLGANGDFVEVASQTGITDLNVGFDEFGKFMILSDESGADQSFSVQAIEDGGIYDVLVIDDSLLSVEVVGTDEKMGGTIEAIYTGEAGNDIVFYASEDKNGEFLQIVMGESFLGTFYDYSYTVADDNFIGDMINNDRIASNYVQFVIESGVTEIPSFEINQSLYLSGGTSGLNNLQDFMYVSALQEYKNLDLYDIDIVAIPGLLSESVVDAMISLCEYRQDCFAIIDTPQSMSPYLVEKWHNGESDTRTTKLDSEYASVYYPWILITTDSVKLPKQWAPPSIRVVGAVTRNDLIKQRKYAIPAGHNNAPIIDIEALETYLTEEDKQTLYADRLQNNINPLVYNKNLGYFIDGQKTTKRGLTPINRIKVIRTALYIKRRCAEIAPEYFYRPINAKTRSDLFNDLTELMNELIANEAIRGDGDYAPVIITDESINTEYVEAQNGLIGRIEWYPVKSVEKIKIVNVIRDKQVNIAIEI